MDLIGFTGVWNSEITGFLESDSGSRSQHYESRDFTTGYFNGLTATSLECIDGFSVNPALEEGSSLLLLD
jgi:hypothetical protein